jgi:putative DNA methylase
MTSTYRKKLIEVAIPLEAINVASAREKSIRHGHPSTFHLWWARRPLAACRAVLFASLVNDPEDDPMYGINENVAYTERAKLFDLIEELVQWDNSNNPRVINAARLEIARSIAANKVADKELNDDTPLVANAPNLPDEQTKYLPEPPPEYTPRDIRFKMPSLRAEQVNHFLIYYGPPVLDPFAGGGSIPLEAQRLGLRAFASDLNPVPVLINKALIELPSRFMDQPPKNPDALNGALSTKIWSGAQGLAEDVRYYGRVLCEEAWKRIGHLYPSIEITQKMVDSGRPDLQSHLGKKLKVMAYLWARTVESPDPAFQSVQTPLASTFLICRKEGNEAWIEPLIDKKKRTIEFIVHDGLPPTSRLDEIKAGSKISRGKFKCMFSNAPIPAKHLKDEGKSKRLGYQPLAVVLIGDRRRLYLSPQHAPIPNVDRTEFLDDMPCPEISGYFNPPIYGFDTIGSLCTPRQSVTLKTFSDLVRDSYDAIRAECGDEYGKAIVTYLALGISRMSNRMSSCSIWDTDRQNVQQAFSEQGVPMAWDFAEANPFSGSSGSWEGSLEWIPLCLERSIGGIGISKQNDAAKPPVVSQSPLISTDPPYYSSITYADFSDYFYGTLRHALRAVYPDLFATMATPKNDEAVAAWHRFDGDRERAGNHFTERLGAAFHQIATAASSDSPITIYYAFKQQELDADEGLVTAWESILRVVLERGLAIEHTWPMRTEQTGGRKASKNSLASSIVIVCRPKSPDLPTITRRDFKLSLSPALRSAVKSLQQCNLAPIDLQQASIGPGMAVFSRFSKVINADGSPMTVREALQLINQVLDESLIEQESDFDAESRFALRWFEQYGMNDGAFGDAETLAKAMAVAVSGIVEAGIAISKAGKVRLLKREELNSDWNPTTDNRLTMWEVTQHLIRTLEAEGESGAADLLQRVGSEKGDIARELAYRLYQTCERKSLAKEAGAYNALVVSWPEISRLSRKNSSTPKQSELELTD